MVRWIIGLVVGCGLLMGQSGSGSTSIYYTIYSNSNTAAPSTTVPNIGQVGHQVFLVFTNAPTKTCTAAGNSITGGFEYSYNTANWYGFGSPPVTSNAYVLNRLYFGVGNFPFVR